MEEREKRKTENRVSEEVEKKRLRGGETQSRRFETDR